VPQAPYKVPFDKATPDRLEDAIENFDAVCSRLSQTRWAGQLQEP
jgi:hypothetical protein